MRATLARIKKFMWALYEGSLVLKALHGALETLAGVLLLFFRLQTLHAWMIEFANDELLENPHDVVANYLIGVAQNFDISRKTFWVVFLVSHGLTKLVIITSLLRGKRWAYPALIAALSVFVAYQSYRLTFSSSAVLLAITVFDLIIIIMTAIEWRWHWKKREAEIADVIR